MDSVDSHYADVLPALQQPSLADSGKGTAAGRVAAAENAGSSVYCPRLEKMSEQLRQTSAQIEESVVGVCLSIQAIAERARAGSLRTAEFLSGIGTGPGRVRSFDELLKACSETMIRLMQMSAQAGEVALQTAERVQQMDRTSREITDELVKLDQIARSNKILALNARIEGARSSEHGAGFSAVAVELSAQTDKSQQVTSQVGELVNKMRAIAASTCAEVETMQSEGDRRIRDCRDEVDATLEALQGAHGRMTEMLGVLTEESELLSRDIGATVRGLQFQDRVSQRIAHVVEDLEALKEHLVDADASGEQKEPRFSSQSMQEERAIYGFAAVESVGGEIELF